MTQTATYNPRDIASIAIELERQKKTKRDYICAPARVRFTDDGKLELGGVKAFKVGDRVHFDWNDAEVAARASGNRLDVVTAGVLPLRPKAEYQLAHRLGLPLTYVSRLRQDGHNDLVAYNFSQLLARDNKNMMVRTLDGQVRAVLSDSYRILDNADLFLCAADTFKEAGAQIWKARLWDDGFEIFAVSPTVAGEVKRDQDAHGGEGHHWTRTTGPDMQRAAVAIRNSETGCGGLQINFAAFRDVCSNGLIVSKGLSQIHLGRRREEEGLIYSEDTNAAESKAIWLKVRDAIRTAFAPEKFQQYLDRLNGLARTVIDDPTLAVTNVVSAYELSDDRRESILKALFSSNDLTGFGLVQAVTYQAHDLDNAGDHEEASRMERIGGDLVGMADKEFAQLVA
jgi:hypothetical protein